MPAVRRRNHCWKDALQQVADRNGAIEISPVRQAGDGPGSKPSAESNDTHLAWRVRLISVTEREIVTEAPIAIGQVIRLHPGLDLVGVMTIGQNRWMFSTKVVGQVNMTNDSHREAVALRLACPQTVERCHRREFSRVSTFQLKLPEVMAWPLLDIASATIAERANEIQFQSAMAAVQPATPGRTAQSKCRKPGAKSPKRAPASDLEAIPLSAPTDPTTSLAMPEVGPPFSALLVNIGGGGIGLLVEPSEADGLARHRLFWLRVALPPELPAPVGVTGRLVHTHMDSTHRTYAGIAFEFDHNRSHQRFVVDQLRRYVELQQQTQLGEHYRAQAS